MNKSKISWCDATLNPLPFCGRGCAYCYANKLRKRLACPDCRDNRPHFHPERLKALGRPPKGRGICFLGSMGDLFDPKTKPAWLQETWQAVENSAWQVVVLTKRPGWISRIRLPQGEWPPNLWLGISAENQGTLDAQMEMLIERVRSHNRQARMIISLEPLLGSIDLTPWLGHLRGVIVGGLSGNWLPDGWTCKDSLVNAQAKWAREIAVQIHRHNLTAIRPVWLWIKDDYGPLPVPAPPTQQHPPEMLGNPMPQHQAGLFG